jgi:hypothetical protein
VAEYALFYFDIKEKVPQTPEEGAKHMAKYRAWLGSLGEALINPGTPLGPAAIASAEGESDSDAANSFSGFSVVKSDSLEAAVEMAKGSPYLDFGNIAVREMKQMG